MKCVTRAFRTPRGIDATPRPIRTTGEGHEGGRRGRRTSERGSSLILALVYIVAVSLIVGALADWAMNDLSNTTHFQNASSLDDAISGATEVAIQSVRYYPNYNVGTTSPTFGNCWTPPSGTYASDVPFTADSNALIAVWCSTLENLKSPSTRIVTLIACPVTATYPVDSTPHASSAEVHCALQPNLLAVVTIDDYPSGGGGLLTQTCSGGQGVCGFAATTNQWTWA
jgi:hypothetical protein